MEARFADIIWNNEPLGSEELVKLCGMGIFRSEDGIVNSLMPRADQRR